MDYLNTVLAFLIPGTVATPGAGPSGPPTSPSFSFYEESEPGNGKIRVQWVTGDATAYSRVYSAPGPGGSFIGATFKGSVNPGITSFDTDLDSCSVEIDCTPATTNDFTLFVTHFKDGIESTDVSVEHP